jgi:hypothetical protein
MMKYAFYGTAALVLVLFLAVCPAQAFTAKNLDITVQDSGDAIISFEHALTWYENAAVFSRIADPGTELAKALRSQFGRNVEVTTISGNHAQFLIENFASRKDSNGMVTMQTPPLSFRNAEQVLNRYWFARFISPDFSPEVSRVSFPDGYAEEFYNQDQIPAVHHSMGSVS